MIESLRHPRICAYVVCRRKRSDTKPGRRKLNRASEEIYYRRSSYKATLNYLTNSIFLVRFLVYYTIMILLLFCRRNRAGKSDQTEPGRGRQRSHLCGDTSFKAQRRYSNLSTRVGKHEQICLSQLITTTRNGKAEELKVMKVSLCNT